MRAPGFGLALALLFGATGPVGAGDRQTVSARGLWLEDIPLCRDTVIGASQEPDSTGQPDTLSIELTAEAGARLARLTSQHVGQPITIWLDGDVLIQPHVQEPIGGGRLSLSGLAEDELARVNTAAFAVCPDTDGNAPPASVPVPASP